MKTIEVNDKVYKVTVAESEEEKHRGLQNVAKLPKDEGMLFIYDSPEEVAFWMKDTHIALDIIFIDEDWEVIRVAEGEPLSEQLIETNDVQYVLELNAKSGVRVGDEVDLSNIVEELDDEEGEEEESSTMLVLNPKGEVQMELEGGERIFSRKNTKTLIRLAKKAYRDKTDRSYKALGRKVFNYLNTQNNKEDDYVTVPE